jgi:hypothetical protein
MRSGLSTIYADSIFDRGGANKSGEGQQQEAINQMHQNWFYETESSDILMGICRLNQHGAFRGLSQQQVDALQIGHFI